LAKKPDHLPDFEADDTGGVLSNLLAEEEEFDRRALWRIGSWGVGATAAVILAVMANQSSLGLKRDQVAAVDLTRQAQQIQLVARESQNEARRLAAAIDTLNSDRDRL
jgi:anti-sigma-K factor RskA